METLYLAISAFMLMNLILFLCNYNIIERDPHLVRTGYALYTDDVFRITINGKHIYCLVDSNVNESGIYIKFKVINKKDAHIYQIRKEALDLLHYELIGTIGMYNYLISF